MKKVISVINDVQMYIYMLEEHKMKVYTDYTELQADLESEFNIIVSIRNIEEVYQPTLEEAELDLKLIYNNI